MYNKTKSLRRSFFGKYNCSSLLDTKKKSFLPLPIRLCFAQEESPTPTSQTLRAVSGRGAGVRGKQKTNRKASSDTNPATAAAAAELTAVPPLL